MASGRGRVWVSLKRSGDLLRGELAVSCLTISLSLSSSGSEGGGSEEEAAALHRSLQVPAQLTQPFVCLRSLHPLCSHQPGGKREWGKTGTPCAPPHPPPTALHRPFSLGLHSHRSPDVAVGRQSSCHSGAAAHSPEQPIAYIGIGLHHEPRGVVYVCRGCVVLLEQLLQSCEQRAGSSWQSRGSVKQPGVHLALLPCVHTGGLRQHISGVLGVVQRRRECSGSSGGHGAVPQAQHQSSRSCPGVCAG